MDPVRAFIGWLQEQGVRPGSDAARLRRTCSPVAGVYTSSLAEVEGATFFLARVNDAKHLVCWGDLRAADSFQGRVDADLKISPCTPENVAPLHALFAFTAPRPVAGERTTFGTGDRLGIATPGHVRAVRDFDAVPVLAQQSTRELNLTGRTFSDVVAAASWGVFQEHFTRGYGADADHVKTEGEIESALRQGATMITLDCSDHIHRQSLGAVEAAYLDRDHLIRNAAGREYNIRFTADQLVSAAGTYGEAIRFTRRVFERYIAAAGCDFELSIDETDTPTDPVAHFYVAQELRKAGVTVTSIAPRFSGEFQKGIDFSGDVKRFGREFELHAAVADHFGHKLSIHSGSDKFAVFPVIGRHTGGRLHHKTAGTSWLEALRVVASADPTFFRTLHAFARETFSEAARYYHVSVRPERLASPGAMPDADLPGLLDDPEHRQLLHIAYGTILTAVAGGQPRFKPALYGLLEKNDDFHYTYLARHIGRHLSALGIPTCRETE